MVAALTALSRVLGLVREMFQSRLIGAGVEQSAFTLAFALPNMARKLFGEGALTAAFVPVFKGSVETDGLAEAAKLARAVMTMVLLILFAVTALACAGLLGALAMSSADPGSVWHLALSPRARLTCELVAILVPYMLAICGAAFGMGVLNSLGRFKAAGFMPALLNILWIAALAVLVFFPGLSVASRIRFVSAAILVGGFAQFAFMLACMAECGVRPWPSFSGWGTEKVRLVWRNLGIAALGAGAIQINYALDQVLAQIAAPWAAGVIGYAERLMDLPLGVVGVAFGTVLLPTFAGAFAKDDVEAARAALADSVRNMMFVMLPAAAGLAVIAPLVVEVIYQGGDFDAAATVRVARALAVYAVGLGFFAIQKSLVPWFQAQNDMKTPLRTTTVCVCVNAALNLAAVFALPVEWRHVGLAASTVVCAALGTFILVRCGIRKNGSLGLSATLLPLGKMLLASLCMAAAVFAADRLLVGLNRYFRLALDLSVGAAVYFAAAVVVLRLPMVSLRRRRRA